jgi:1,2-diacylglycerol 3-beta-galactosyltransferase
VALTEALHRLEPGVKVSRADPLIGQGPRVVSRLAALYSPLIRRSRALWAVVYYGSNLGGSFAAIRAVLGPQVRRVLEGLLARHDPDLVLSVHPLVNHVAWQAMGRGARRRGLMIVVTDLVEFHRGWSFPRADLVAVPSEGAFDECRRRHVPVDRLRVLGLPVSLRFRPAAPGEKAALRRRFGLAEDRFTILVIGGGEGTAGMIEQVRALCWREHDWQVIAVCGRNERLRRRLGRVRFRTPTAVLGFVDHMPELMRAADLVVTKAGPGAIGEALASDLPLLITSHLPGQETANIGYVTSTGVGLYVPDPEALLAAASRLAADGGRLAKEMADRAAQVWRPYAALDIAREAITIARRYAQPQTEASQANR